MHLFKGAVAFSASILLLACSSSPNDARGSGDQAPAVSPLMPGFYEDANTILLFYGDPTSQHGSVRASKKNMDCEGSIVVNGDNAHFDSDPAGGTCHLALAPTSCDSCPDSKFEDVISATGTDADMDVNTTLSRRKEDALAHEYRNYDGQKGEDALVIEASSEWTNGSAFVTFSLYPKVPQGESVSRADEKLEHVRADTTDDPVHRTYAASINRCKLSLDVRREDGTYWFAYWTEGAPSDCAIWADPNSPERFAQPK
jgi:hypothetical protein